MTEEKQSLGMIVSRAANPTDAIDRAAQWFAKSGLFGCDRTEQGAILALTCISENISPVEFSRTYDIVEGRLRKKSMAAFAEFRKRGGKVKWIASGDDGQKASAEFTFEGQTVSLSYSIEQAMKSGLVKPRGAWEKNPSNMLRARVISNALGMLCPEIYAGEYDDNDDRASAPAQQINLAAPPEPKPAVATVVDVAPAAPDSPELIPASAAQSSDVLPVDIQEKLLAAIGVDRLPDAVAYCQRVGWLGHGDPLEVLPIKRANQILARVDRFLAAISPEAK